MNTPDAFHSNPCSDEEDLYDFDKVLLPAALAEAAAKAAAAAAALAESSRVVRDERDPLRRSSSDGPGQQGFAGTIRSIRDRVNDQPESGKEALAAIPKSYFTLLETGKNPGVYWIGVESDGSTYKKPCWICSPLRVVANTRDGQGSEWGRLLLWDDRDGREHRWAMPMALLAADGVELRRYLLSEGVTIATNPNVRARLPDYITSERPQVTARCVTRTGWQGDAFVLPRETFGDSASEPVLFQATHPGGVALGAAGTLDGWLEHVARPCAGHSRLVLALCAGFAGPCLGLLGMAGAGFHLRGASSSGKSTALSVAASLFGAPEYSRTWRHTDNALEGVAALHSDLLLILDEIGQLDPKHAGDVAYLLANGQGKGRAARDGSPRALTTWRILFLSAGEISLTDLVVQSGGKARAGQDVRVIDLPVDAGSGNGVFETLSEGVAPGVLADALKAASASHYGHALPAFLGVLTGDPATVRETLLERRSAISKMLMGSNQAGQVRRVAEYFALVAAAGELATVHGLTGWEGGEATRAVQACFLAWLEARGTDGAAEPAAMLEQVRGFLSANSEARFAPWDEDFSTEDGRLRTINRAGYRKKSEDGPVYYVEREAFKSEVCKGFNPKAVSKVLAEAGALMLDSDGGSTRKERLPDGRRTRVYVVTSALWGVE